MYSTKMRIYAKKANTMIIKRPLYLKQLINRQHNGIIKIISGMTLATTKAHVVRAALESIAYQVTDLVRTMTEKAGITLKEIRVDGGPTKNKFLMQMQSDLLQAPVVRSEVEDASAFGALVMNRFALGAWKTFSEAEQAWECLGATTPAHTAEEMAPAYDGWKQAVQNLM